MGGPATRQLIKRWQCVLSLDVPRPVTHGKTRKYIFGRGTPPTDLRPTASDFRNKSFFPTEKKKALDTWNVLPWKWKCLTFLWDLFLIIHVFHARIVFFVVYCCTQNILLWTNVDQNHRENMFLKMYSLHKYMHNLIPFFNNKLLLVSSYILLVIHELVAGWQPLALRHLQVVWGHWAFEPKTL